MAMLVAVVLALVILVVILKESENSDFRDVGGWSNSANDNTSFDKKIVKKFPLH